MARQKGSVTRFAETMRPSRGPTVVIVACAALAAILLWRGYDFYGLDLDSRVDHDDFRVLGPGELWGHGYGVVGTLLILTNLLYLLRRRFAWMNVGSMKTWLDMHVATGLLGSVLIVYHSAFQLRSPVAMVTSVSLATVVFTGVIGRYLHALAPSGNPQQMVDNIIALDELIPGMGKLIRTGLSKRPPTRLPGDASLFRAVSTLPRWFLDERARRVVVKEAYHELTRPRSLTKEELKSVKAIAKSTARLAAGDVRSEAGTALLRTWRGLHRFLAILMILSVSLHIGVAWFYGYRWLLSE